MNDVSLAVRAFCMLLIIGLVQYYMWRRLVRDTQLPPWARKATTAWGVLMLALTPLALFGRRLHLGASMQPLVMLILCWGGFLLIALGLLLLAEPLRWLPVGRSRGPQDPERRQMLQRVLGSTVASLGGVGSGVAVAQALSGPQVVSVQVPIARLPRSLAGFTIAQISDLHIAPQLGLDYVEETVRRANALNPQLIAITGDLLDGPIDTLRDMAAPLTQLKAPHGVYFVTGNHEYYSGTVDAWLEELTRLGVRVLRNACVPIGDGAECFDLAGVDDLSAHGDGHGVDLPKALQTHQPSRPLVLLAHQPKMIFEAAAAGVNLMLCGHTHAGQIWPLGWFVRLVQPYVQGLSQHAPQTYIYVNRGTGYVGPPMRLPQPPELTLVTLMVPTSASTA